MSESAETKQRKGFVSPLQKAQAGRIGGGKEQPPPELQDVPTLERQDVSIPGEADAVK